MAGYNTLPQKKKRRKSAVPLYWCTYNAGCGRGVLYGRRHLAAAEPYCRDKRRFAYSDFSAAVLFVNFKGRFYKICLENKQEKNRPLGPVFLLQLV